LTTNLFFSLTFNGMQPSLLVGLVHKGATYGRTGLNDAHLSCRCFPFVFVAFADSPKTCQNPMDHFI
jgi:hypothetical protein